MRIYFRVVLLIIFSGTLCFCSKEEPVDQFNFNTYEKFISKISQNDSILIVPLKDFNSVNAPEKIVIGLRHDIDNSIDAALEIAKIENKFGVVSSFYVLHTADYYLINHNDKSKRNPKVIENLKAIQNTYKHEIGWHNDLVTLQIVYGINSKEFFKNELGWLRQNGINITGTCAHGSEFIEKYQYVNFYFFKERSTFIPNYINIDFVIKDGKRIDILKGTFQEYGLNYEAYDMKCNYYYTDRDGRSSGLDWDPNKIDINTWKKGDKIIILSHPY